MKENSYYINLALKEAEKALKADEVPVGAVIIKDDEIISKAYNRKEKDQKATSHAEILAINKACKKLGSWHLDGCTMYVTLEPCMMCCGAIIQSRISSVIYGATSYQDGAIESSFVLRKIEGLNHYPKTLFYKDENCSRILSDYFKKKR